MVSETSICVGIPTLNDGENIGLLLEKTVSNLQKYFNDYEIIVVNDGSTDNTKSILSAFASKYPFITVITHEENKGYGYSLIEIIKTTQKEWICLIDGDNEFNIDDIKNFIPHFGYYELIMSFRYKKLYSFYRIILSLVYNQLLSFLFKTKFRDVSAGLRFIKKSAVENLNLTSHSPFIGAEIAIKIVLKGYRFGEVGVQQLPSGKSYSTTPRNIYNTIADMRRVYKEVFSKNYNPS